MESYDDDVTQLRQAIMKLREQNYNLQFRIDQNNYSIDLLDKAVEKQKELDTHEWVTEFAKELNSGVDNRYKNDQN